MRLSSKTAIITSAGVILLGTSLALWSEGVVSGASAIGGSGLIQPAATCSLASAYCLTESNTSAGSGHHGAIEGTTDGANATAIYGLGYGTNSIGVDGASHGGNGIGVAGVSTGFDGAGLSGVDTKGGGIGVDATGGDVGLDTNGGYAAVLATGGNNGVATVATRANGVGLYDQSPLNGYPIDSFGVGSGAGTFSTDGYGDGVFDGTVSASGFNTDIRRSDGSRVTARASLAPRATIEDAGTARLINGVGVVHLERDFASTVDTSKGYQVFVTPDGDTRGWLYVAQKFEGGFIVREAERGRSSVYFDYRVVAHLAGSSDERFPIYNPKRPPRLNLPAHLQQVHLPSGS